MSMLSPIQSQWCNLEKAAGLLLCCSIFHLFSL